MKNNGNIFIKENDLKKDEKKKFIGYYKLIKEKYDNLIDFKGIDSVIEFIIDNINQNFDDPEEVIKKIEPSLNSNKDVYMKKIVSPYSRVMIEISLLESMVMSFNEPKFVHSLLITKQIREKKKKLLEIAKGMN